MDAKLVRWGDALAVRFTAEEAQALGIGEGQTVEVRPKPEQTSAGASSSTGRRFSNGVPVYTLEDMVAEMRRLGPASEPATVDWGPDRGSEIIDDDDPR